MPLDASGDTIDTSGTLLLSQTIGRDVGSATVSDFQLFEVLFTSSLAVSDGDKLAIVLSDVNAGQNDGFRWESGGDGVGYEDGSPWQTFTADVAP